MKFEKLHNPNLWRWKLVPTAENEVTGYVQVNVGYLERMVKEGKK